LGAVMALHTAGETLAFHPHIHCIVSSGVFDNDDLFQQKTFNTEALKKSFEQEVARVMSSRFEELEAVFNQIFNQENTGFNVWAGDLIESQDSDTRKFLGRYLMRHPFSLDRITFNEDKVTVISSKESIPNWQGTPLEFLARLSLHIPNHYEHLERFYGRYSPVTRGALKEVKVEEILNEPDTDNSQSNELTHFFSKSSLSKSSWASCIKLVYEINPMECPECKGQMKIIAFIKNHREIEKILDSARLPRYRAPPPFAPQVQPMTDLH
jgi:hypothetical protein